MSQKGTVLKVIMFTFYVNMITFGTVPFMI